MIKDSVYEMMTDIQYQVWAADAANGGLTPLQASAKWKELCDLPGAVLDELGHSPEYKKRVAVKTKDVILDPQASIQREGFKLMDQVSKNTSQKDIDNAMHRLSNAQFGDTDKLNEAKTLASTITTIVRGWFRIHNCRSQAEIWRF